MPPALLRLLEEEANTHSSEREAYMRLPVIVEVSLTLSLMTLCKEFYLLTQSIATLLDFHMLSIFVGHINTTIGSDFITNFITGLVIL